MKYKKLLFGTAGIPLSTVERGTANGIKRVKELGLSCMELEFVRSVNIKKENAPPIKKVAGSEDVELTCHGQYYINLSSLEKPKIHASVKRVLNAARIANLCGAKSVTFHAGYYMKRGKEEVYEIIKRYMKEIIGKLKDEGNPIIVRPETTGKATQWGDVDEIIRLSSEIEQVLPCVDFSHLHARSNGGVNSKPAFDEVLEKVEKALGKEALKSMHCHVSGIEYGEKGERNHLVLKESDFKYKELMKSFKEFNVKGCVICESPNIEEDALLMKKKYEGL
jgi:deoxyribonuclease-4